MRRLKIGTGFLLWLVPTKAIYTQTWDAFRNREHPYRQILERASGGRVKLFQYDNLQSQGCRHPVDKESERYTSQTCPACRNRKKPTGRVYSCPKCGWEGHRDVVGASNIWTKYQGWAFTPVVVRSSVPRPGGTRGGVVSPVGVRFNAHLCHLDSWSPFRGLISKKPVKNR